VDFDPLDTERRDRVQIDDDLKIGRLLADLDRKSVV
jgi:hypothetical protein